MSQGYVPGPCQIFLGTGASGAWQFLGYSQDGVRTRLVAAYRDIYSDFGGPDIPVDSQFMGEHGYISMDLNKYNESVLQVAAGRRKSTASATVVPGAIEANGLGSLMIAEGFSYQILIYAPYSTKAFQNGSIVPGYVFSAGWLHDEFETPISVLLKVPRPIFRVIPVWNSTTLQAQLYTNTMPATIPSVN